jgi:hypothetical protein
MNLDVQVELALADAGLEQLSEAGERLDALLRSFTPLQGPLTLSALHEARAQLAALQRDARGPG